MTRAAKNRIEIDEELRLQEANRMLSIASRKREAAELLIQHDFWVESVQMYQQAMELCVKAVMTVLVGHFYLKHEFSPSVVRETLRACHEKWPQRYKAILERCFEIANRWSSKRELGTYGYVYGTSGKVLILEQDARQARKDARSCFELAQLIISRYEKLRSK